MLPITVMRSKRCKNGNPAPWSARSASVVVAATCTLFEATDCVTLVGIEEPGAATEILVGGRLGYTILILALAAGALSTLRSGGG